MSVGCWIFFPGISQSVRLVRDNGGGGEGSGCPQEGTMEAPEEALSSWVMDSSTKNTPVHQEHFRVDGTAPTEVSYCSQRFSGCWQAARPCLRSRAFYDTPLLTAFLCLCPALPPSQESRSCPVSLAGTIVPVCERSCCPHWPRHLCWPHWQTLWAPWLSLPGWREGGRGLALAVPPILYSGKSLTSVISSSPFRCEVESKFPLSTE